MGAAALLPKQRHVSSLLALVLGGFSGTEGVFLGELVSFYRLSLHGSDVWSINRL